VIEFKENRGKGFGVKEGMLSALGNFRLFTDADNSTPINQVEKIWPEFEAGYDIVIGSRDIKGAILDPPQPLFRRFTGEVFKYLRKMIVDLWGIEDSQCGFKCLTKKAAEDIFPKCKINRFAFDPEILLIGKKMGYKIKEIPIYWKNDLQSKVKLKSMIKMLIDLFKIRLNEIKGFYDKKI
jgi:dolichyl-phosphate beta-glucosyltransferase